MTAQQERKQVIRKFMRENYSDDRLAQLLAHAQEGKLNYFSCCCFVGVHDAKHALRTRKDTDWEGHEVAIFSPCKREASTAYGQLVPLEGEKVIQTSDASDLPRRRILIPMIKAEMKRRSLLREGKELGVLLETVPA